MKVNPGETVVIEHAALFGQFCVCVVDNKLVARALDPKDPHDRNGIVFVHGSRVEQVTDRSALQ